MSTFSRFSALCHLDLNLLCTDQITAGNTKSSGSNLLYGRSTLGIQTLQALTTLTRVGFSM